MAVVSVQERTEGQQATIGTGKQYRRVWLVTLSSATDGARVASTASAGGVSIPSRGNAHPNNTSAKVVRIDPQMHGDQLHWLVAVDYQTPDSNRTSADEAENPLNDPVEVTWSTEFQTVPITEAFDGTNKIPVLNSANDPFDPPVEQEDATSTVTIVRNEAHLPKFGADYVNTVNSAATTIAGLPVKARQARIVECSAQRAERNGTRYWQVTYRILFKLKDITGTDDNWDRHVLDQGYFEWPDGIGADKQRRRIAVDGKEAKEPQRLDGSGVALAPETAQKDSIWRTFRTYRERSFAPLSLDFNP